MAEAATTDATVIEPDNSKPEIEVATMDHTADADDAEEIDGAGAADPEATQKTSTTTKRAKAKVSSRQSCELVLSCLL